jgi:hypothetical protein
MDDMSTHIKSMCLEFLFFAGRVFNNNNKISTSTNLINFSFEVIFFRKCKWNFQYIILRVCSSGKNEVLNLGEHEFESC